VDQGLDMIVERWSLQVVWYVDGLSSVEFNILEEVFSLDQLEA
jgi:hypothetical protein